MKLSIVILIFSVLTVSCIEPFEPATTGYDEILFIEARLTDDIKLPPSVSISKTQPLRGSQDTGNSRQVSGADVYVLCDDGNEYPFYETLSGKYIPQEITFTGETGKSYKLIIYYDGNTYESGFEKLPEPSPVDSLAARIETHKRSEAGEAVDGLRFLVSTHRDGPPPSYYRWILDATFMYDVPFRASHIYDGEKPVFYNNPEIYTCWKSYDINGLFLSDTDGLTEDAVVNAPLNFVDQYGDELALNYSLHALQLAISKETYEFWSDLDKLTNQTGGLYESQPFRLEGNVKCTTDPSVNVTGVFEVAGVSEAREFFIPPDELEIMRLECEYTEAGTESLPWNKVPFGAYFLYEEDDPFGHFYTARPECFDCRARGGTTEKPAFWE